MMLEKGLKTHTRSAWLIAEGVTHSLAGQLQYERSNVLELLIIQKDLTSMAGLKQKRNQWLFYPLDHTQKHSQKYPHF